MDDRTTGQRDNGLSFSRGAEWRLLALKTVLPIFLTVILFISTIYIIALPALRRAMMDSKKEMISELANTAWGLLIDYNARVESGELSVAEAQERAIDRIGALRYGPEREDYFWINDMRPVMIMHPYRTDLVGKDLSDFKDPEGNHLFIDFVDTVQDGGEGFVEYLWQWKSDSTRIVPKYSFVKGFTPWGWIVGTGMYVEDVYAEIDLITRRVNFIFFIILALVLLLSFFIIIERREIERKRLRTEESLLMSERKFRSISSSAMDAVVMMDHMGDVSFWNEAAEKIFGYKAEEVTGKPIHDAVLPPDSDTNHMEIMEEFRKTGQSRLFGEVLSMIAGRKDGSRFPVEMTISPVMIEGKVNVVGIIRDVSKRIDAEKRLRESRERWTLHIDNTPLGFIQWDTDFRVIEWNPAAEAIFGYSLEEASGRRSDELVIPEDVIPSVADVWQKLLKQRGGTRSTNENITKDGRVILCDWFNTTLVNDDGKVIGVSSLIRDVTEIRKAEEDIRKQSAALEQAFDGIAVVGMDDRIQFVNTSWARMHGYTAEELTGQDYSISHTEEQSRGEVALLLKELERNGGASAEVGHRRKDESVFPSRMTLSRLMDERGKPAGIIVTVQDISERKKLLSQLLQSQRVESIGLLAGGIAHDFNNLLSPILGYSEMLLTELSPEDPRADDITQIKMAAERGRDLTRQLLAFGRKQMLEVKKVDMCGILTGFEKILRRTIREDIVLEINLLMEPAMIEVDVTQIEMILMNLAVNAMDAMPNGGRITITVSETLLEESSIQMRPGTVPGRYVELSFSDTGEGMDEETASRVFEPFYTTKEQGKGTGLGLSTVYGIVQQHKGNIWLYSEKNIGTTFRIYLPKVEVVSPAVNEDKKALSEEVGGSETILVVEDEDIVRALVSRILTRCGYRVIQYARPVECLRSLQSFSDRIDLLLTDVVMPGMNGRELYDKLAGKIPGLRVIYMSGYTDDVIVHQGIIDDGVEYIQKPFSNNDLSLKIRKSLDTAGPTTAV
ncbi:MAG: PAS domain S-box protein [Bacteroidales bacterium]|nr:PAS domain S-box protein [Candidatus Latescibacterota bacterium]